MTLVIRIDEDFSFVPAVTPPQDFIFLSLYVQLNYYNKINFYTNLQNYPQIILIIPYLKIEITCNIGLC